jgi:hypothetical protein
MKKANYIGKENILRNWEELAETPYFSIWDQKSKMLQNNVNDFDTASEKLEKYLNNNQDHTDTICILIHPESKKSYCYNDYKDAVAMLYCQIHNSPIINNNTNDSIQLQILQEVRSMNSRITALETEEIEEEENNQVGAAETELLDKISGIVNSPLGVLLTTYAPRFLDRVLPEKPKHLITGLAGNTPTDLETTIDILFSKGVKLEHFSVKNL